MSNCPRDTMIVSLQSVQESRANSYCDNVASSTIGQWRLQWNLIGTKFWPVSLQFLSCPLVPSSSSDLSFPFHGHLYFSTFYPLRCFWGWKPQTNMFKVTNSLYKTLCFSPALGLSPDLNFPFHFLHSILLSVCGEGNFNFIDLKLQIISFWSFLPLS